MGRGAGRGRGLTGGGGVVGGSGMGRGRHTTRPAWLACLPEGLYAAEHAGAMRVEGGSALGRAMLRGGECA